jgi:hypothetical protein
MLALSHRRTLSGLVAVTALSVAALAGFVAGRHAARPAHACCPHHHVARGEVRVFVTGPTIDRFGFLIEEAWPSRPPSWIR